MTGVGLASAESNFEKKIRTLAAATALAVSVLAISATDGAAATLIATYTGLVTGHDQIGLFDPNHLPGGLSGVYELQFFYATTKGYDQNLLPYDEEIYGGYSYNLTSPVSATLNIEGITVPINGNYYSFVNTTPGNNTLETYAKAVDLISPSKFIISYVDNVASVNEPNVSSLIGLTSTNSSGYAEFDLYNTVTHTESVTYANLGLGQFGRNLETVQVSAAPEPSTWALLIAGLGLAGTVLRRRRLRQPSHHRDRKHLFPNESDLHKRELKISF